MKASPSSRLALAAASMGMLGLASAAQATLIAYEGLTGDSLTTSLSNAANTSPAGGTASGWASGWAPYSTDPEGTVQNSNLSYNGNTYGYAAQFGTTASSYDFRPLTAPQSTAAGSSYFVSYLLSGITNSGNQVNFISLYSGTAAPTTGSAGGLNAGQMITFGNLSSTIGLGVQYVTSASGNTNVAANVTVTSTSTVTLLVFEITYGGSGNDSYNFWINPTSQSPAPNLSGSLTLYGADGGTAAVDPALGMIRIGSNSVSSDPAIFDEIKVGTTFLDVAPEPASISVFGAIGTLALLRRGRRSALDSNT